MISLSGRTVHEYFRLWSQPNLNGISLLDEILAQLVMAERVANGRDEEPSCIIVDSLRFQKYFDSLEKGYDGGQKVSGIKRHLAVDTLGLPHAIYVSTANVTERAGAIEAFLTPAASLTEECHVIADGVYTGDNLASQVKEWLNSSVTIVKRPQIHEFVVLPKRWIVERAFAWLEKCRLLKEKLRT